MLIQGVHETIWNYQCFNIEYKQPVKFAFFDNIDKGFFNKVEAGHIQFFFSVIVSNIKLGL